MGERRITLQEVERYIGGKRRRNLRKDLRTDYCNHRFIKEADLEVCTYYHLRKFLKPDTRWKVFARAYRRGLGRFPDITILDGKVPKIAIELKWKKKQISEKDRRTLNKFLASPHARKGYFITTVTNKSDYKRLGSKKKPLEKNRLRELPIPLDLGPARLKTFTEERKNMRAALR